MNLTDNNTVPSLSHERGIWLVLLLFVLLCLAWNAMVPIYEAPDEPDHVQYVDYFVKHANLPDSRTDLAVAGIESTQSPLYYLAGGILLRMAGVSSFYTKPAENPNFTFDFGNPEHNRFIAQASSSDLAIHVLRFLSTFGGVITIAATFVLARVLAQRHDVALLAASIVAFLPQFTFIASAVNNDSLAAASGAVVLVLATRLSDARVVTTRHAALLGFATGLAVLSKASLLVFALASGLVAIYHRGSSRAALIRSGVVFMLSFVVGGGWFFLRNLYLYGNLLDWQARTLIGASQAYPPELLREYFVYVFPQMLSRSFVGVFGWMNILLPEPVYLLCFFVSLPAFLGLWFAAWKRRLALRYPWLILLLALSLLAMSVVAWNVGYFAFQGRLLFPGIAGITILLARGWATLPQRLRVPLFFVIPLGLLALNLFSLYFVYFAYR